MRGHPHKNTKDQIERAKALKREQLLGKSKDKTNSVIPFIIHYTPRNMVAETILTEAAKLIRDDPRLTEFRKKKPIIAYRRSANLRHILTKSSYPSTKTAYRSRPCTHSNCDYCDHIEITTKLHYNGTTFKTKGDNNCQTRSVIYAIKCPTCNLLYIGETGRKVKERIYDHMYNLKRKNRNIPLTKHLVDHDVSNTELRFILLDNTANNRNERLRLEEA